MVLGVLSDTHGNREMMNEVVEQMTGRHSVELLFHLGDDYLDAEFLESNGFAVRAVPGLWCSQYHDSRIPKRFVEHIDGLTVVAVHAAKDLRAVDYAANIVLTGHTHQARIEFIPPCLHVNPGHLRSEASRGESPSFAVITIGPAQVRAAIHELDGAIRRQVVLPRIKLA